MNEAILNEVCRVCANKIKDKKRQRHMFKYMRGKLLLSLKLITGVELSKNEELPKFICDRCHSELDLAIKFRERCIFSQNYLGEILQKKREELVVEKAERELYEDLIDEEQLEYVDEDLELIEEAISEDVPDDVSEMLTADELTEFEEYMEEVPSPNHSKDEKRHFVMLPESRPAKRSRNFFICEECGEYFNHEHDYNNHIEGHVEHKVSKQFYPCTQCPVTYNTSAALKHHRRQIHDGGRLFKCATCGETFLEHSAKQRHEIAHVNERPYPCLECDKIFTTVSELRRHCTSHAKPKFSCDLVLDTTSTQHPHKLFMGQIEDEIDTLSGEELEFSEYY